MRSTVFISLCGLLVLTSGCDTVAPQLSEDALEPLLPLVEGNQWVVERTRLHPERLPVQSTDTLTVEATFSHAGETWASISGSSTYAMCAAGFFSLRDSGYYYAALDPRDSGDAGQLKYAYPAEAGTQYVIDGTVWHGEGRRSVTVLATDEIVQTPWGEREAYRYRFTVDTFFLSGVEYAVSGVEYDRVLVPGVGFAFFDTHLVTYGSEAGTLRAAETSFEWSLIDASIASLE